MTTKIPVDLFIAALPGVLKDITISAGGTHAHPILHEMYKLAESLHEEVNHWDRKGTALEITEKYPLFRGMVVLDPSWSGWASYMKHARMDDDQVTSRVSTK